ncbi:MAG: NAD(P)H-hydrate dehydratase [Paracoccaceae bacterium]
MELLTAAQMRAIEAAAIDSGAVTGLELMERAGRGVVEAIFAEWPELGEAPGGGAGGEAGGFPPPDPRGYLGRAETQGARRAVVLCGPGNNGGDGFVVARLLKKRGWAVEVFLYGDPERLPPDARVNYERWRGIGEVGEWCAEAIENVGEEDIVDLFVDAVFGSGLSRPPDDDVLGPMLTAFYGKERVVSIDCVTGLCATSGRALERYGIVSFVSLTVTFHAGRIGHYLADGPSRSGKVVVKPLDIWLRAKPRPSVELIDSDQANLAKSSDAYKYTHGHALILSGPAARTGAARLAARGALRIGAGLVTVGGPAEALGECAAHLTSVTLREVGTAEGLRGALADERINGVCVGPGLGLDARGREVVIGVLAAKRATVLDADALTILSREPAPFAELHPRCVLTPHHGEFARLFPDIAEKLAAPATKGPAYSKVDATREAAARAGCVVLYKGPDTVIADPSGRCSINSAAYERAAPWLATAGSGDVLAGFISGLLARGFAPFDAAGTAAWLHLECARSFGPGLIAEDLPEELPKVFRALGL